MFLSGDLIAPGIGTLTLDDVPNFGLVYHDRGVNNFTFTMSPEEAIQKLPSQFPAGAVFQRVAAPASAPSSSPAGASSGFPRVVYVNVDGLAVRSAPTTGSALAGAQRLSKGDHFTATSVVNGDMVAGESRWWVSSFGHYVWVGGTNEKP